MRVTSVNVRPAPQELLGGAAANGGSHQQRRAAVITADVDLRARAEQGFGDPLTRPSVTPPRRRDPDECGGAEAVDRVDVRALLEECSDDADVSRLLRGLDQSGRARLSARVDVCTVQTS